MSRTLLDEKDAAILPKEGGERRERVQEYSGSEFADGLGPLVPAKVDDPLFVLCIQNVTRLAVHHRAVAHAVGKPRVGGRLSEVAIGDKNDGLIPLIRRGHCFVDSDMNEVPSLFADSRDATLHMIVSMFGFRGVRSSRRLREKGSDVIRFKERMRVAGH